ncbi:MAG: hypothetical protein U0835_11690 [Isosphaeraceae bacterium]
MSARDRAGRKAGNRLGPSVERLEGRSLLSFYGPLRPAPARLRTAAVVGDVSASNVVGAPPPPLGAPSPAEAARSRFVAKLAGTFETAPGRYEKQPLQGIVLTTGGSNQALRLQSQMQFFLYSDPSLTPNGQINLSAKNVSNTGNQLILDLTADPTSPAQHGLPTRYNFTVSDSSGGLWSNATGSGILEISYRYTGRPHGARGKGNAIIVIQGTVVTNHGLLLNTSLPGNRVKNP